MQNNIRLLLIISFVLTVIIFGGVFSYGISQIESVRDQSNKIVANNNTKSEIIGTMVFAARERVLDLYAMINSDDPFERDELFLDFNKQGAVFARARLRLLALELTDKEIAILERQGALTGKSVPIQNTMVDLIQTEEIEEARRLLNEKGVEAQDKVLEQLVLLEDLQEQSSKQILKEIDKKFIRGRETILVWSLFAFMLGGIVAYNVLKKTGKIEHRLFQEIEKTRATLVSINDAILTIDKENNILFSNKRAEEIFGKNIVHMKIENILGFIDLTELENKQDIYHGNVGRYEANLNSINYIFDVTVSDIRNERDENVGSVLVLHDVTNMVDAQKRLQIANETLEKRVEERTLSLGVTNEQLKESLKSLAETQENLIHSEKMAALGGLVAGISHEINTPIGISVTSATNIEEKIKAMDKDFTTGELTKDGFASYIDHSMKGLKILIKNLGRASDLIRSFKQVAVDQSSDEIRDINLRSYCNEIILSLHPKLKKTRIKVDNRITDSISMRTNPGALYQILSNLIVNSVVHGFEGANVSNPEVIIEAEVEDEYVSIQYRDNGIGVEKSVLSKIFEPFFTTKRGQGGSGLGMNVVYNLITTTLDGRVSAESEPGEGLVISISVPLTLKGDV